MKTEDLIILLAIVVPTGLVFWTAAIYLFVTGMQDIIKKVRGRP